jgi:HTH-type transcriptional regulator/antitoxin HigA
MITNERQYKITKAVLDRLRESIKGFNLEKAHAAIGNKTLAKAQLDALESEGEVLSDQIKEYEILKSGAIEDFRTESLRELPSVLVKARIAKGMSQRQLAERLGLKEQQIQRYEAERYATASLRRVNEIADALGLHVTKHARLHADAPKIPLPRKSPKLDWSRFPVREMYQRGWFPEFTGSLREAELNADHLLARFLTVAGARPTEALHRKHVRSGSTLDDYALLAWECRILWLAEKERTRAPFKVSEITSDWIRKLIQLSAQKNSATLAKEYLRNSGITLVIEPHLPQTYLDGAALLPLSDRPIVGMTLRYDRLDNFWFVLLHELGHLLLHLRKNNFKRFFDDLDAAADELESEADKFANESLIPDAVWEIAVARYLRTSDTIKDLANELGISPAIIAGRIRRESDNYVILKDIVGLGEIRRQFSEVKFGQ